MGWQIFKYMIIIESGSTKIEADFAWGNWGSLSKEVPLKLSFEWQTWVWEEQDREEYFEKRSLKRHQWISRIDFLYDWLVWSPCCPRDSQESLPTPQFKSINSSALSLFMVQLSHLYTTTGKTIALTIWIFVSKVMSLLLICWQGISELSFQGESIF